MMTFDFMQPQNREFWTAMIMAPWFILLYIYVNLAYMRLKEEGFNRRSLTALVMLQLVGFGVIWFAAPTLFPLSVHRVTGVVFGISAWSALHMARRIQRLGPHPPDWMWGALRFHICCAASSTVVRLIFSA